MNRPDARAEGGLATEERGEGEAVLLYLHGLNANGAVWESLDALAAEQWPGRRLILDLPGHGESPTVRRYSYGDFAARVATEIGDAQSVTIIGHSMGGVIALALASGWFAVPVEAVLAYGVKVNWTDQELERLRGISEKPARVFDTHEEAVERFLRVSGLGGIVDAEDPSVTRGVRELPEGGFRLAADPRAGAVGAPSVRALMHAARGQVRMACGELDALVGIEELRRYDADAEVWQGVGHNAQTEAPSQVWDTFQRLIDEH